MNAKTELRICNVIFGLLALSIYADFTSLMSSAASASTTESGVCTAIPAFFSGPSPCSGSGDACGSSHTWSVPAYNACLGSPGEPSCTDPYDYLTATRTVTTCVSEDGDCTATGNSKATSVQLKTVNGFHS